MEYTGQGAGSILGDEARDGEEDEEEDKDEPCHPSAVWDDVDKVFRCNKCCWETEDGVCDYCGIEYDVPEEFSDTEQKAFFDNDTTISAAYCKDRSLKPRGDTPLPEYNPIDVPWLYRPTRVDEYAQLRRRGATINMCKTFSLSFDMDQGITAELTPQIKETFGGPEMLETDTWMLYLGRRVTPDEDDLDGSDFIIGLLEDALLFEHCHYSIGHTQWTTVRPKGKTNLWITYPTQKHVCYIYEVSDTSDDSGDDSGDCPDSEAPEAEMEAWYNHKALVKPFVEFGPTIHRDEYEMTDVEDLESDDDGDSDAADAGYAINPRYDDGVWPDGENDGMYESEPESEDIDDDSEADEDEDRPQLLELTPLENTAREDSGIDSDSK
ncbi:hypothetical protein K435DRAFT_785043 [Dendrothele bispora CBS 962.96]|uniref:DUF8191 domain-containing protein n=1 Tax=Dendrothele bispora (strain CBS 962.96) TaxID=1314807 RepID=A0A4S8KZ74_DENBC|nr:hypothetical protein K435DRAFT_785043 [Dendrothele bispora CBS 962.96]